jgi:SPP1 family predicted phage head-tail adaptor
MIGELDRRINFKSWGATQDPGGGAIPIILLTYNIWAKVEARSGQMYTGEQQSVWNYDYKITFRFEKSRVVASNYTIDYDGKRLSINSVSFIEEGNRKFVIVKCTTTDASIDTSRDILATVLTFDYYGIGGETVFTADGTPMTLPTVAKDLRNKTVIGAFKDGVNFNVLLNGPFTDPSIKQVIYNSALGSFTWSIAFEPLEHALIQYIGLCECP